MATDRIGFAVIGGGKMGRRRIETVVRHPYAELICIVDNNEGNAKSLARKAQCAYYTDIKEAIMHDEVDCVVVSTPNKFHAATAISAMEDGKHVFCEKPVAMKPEEASLMVETAFKRKVFLKTGSNLRYFPNVLKAKKLVDSDAIGKLLYLRGWIGNSGKHLQNSWYADAEIVGGGTFLDNGCHLLDLTRWFIGEVVECTGYVETVYWPIQPLEDNGFGIFKTSDGRLASIHSSWTEWADYMYLEIYGTDGYIRVDNRDRSCRTVLGKKNGVRYTFDYSLLPSSSYRLEFQDFVNALLNGKQPLPSGYDGMRAVQMAYGIYESSRTGRAVKIYGDLEKKLSKLMKYG